MNPRPPRHSNVIPLRRTPPPTRKKRQQPETWGPPIEIKSAESWRYQWHREILKRWDLNRTDLAVASALMHAFQAKGWGARIGYDIIAERAGCSKREAIRSSVKLRDLGLIKVRNVAPGTAD